MTIRDDPVIATQEALALKRGVREPDWSLVAGLVLMGLVVTMTIVGFVWTPVDPGAVDTGARLLPPGTPGHPLGTDNFGRDVVTELMAGARTSLYIAVLGSSIALVAGVIAGSTAATMGGLADDVIARASDVVYAFPTVLLALILSMKLGAGPTAAVIAIAVWSTPTVTRLTRGAASQVFQREFVVAARAYGRSRWYILLRHVLPNIVGLLIVQVTTMFALAIVIEAALAYLGVGAQPPTASWGRMLKEATPFIQAQPVLSVWPGITIVLSALGFNLIGDGVRNRLDVRRSMPS